MAEQFPLQAVANQVPEQVPEQAPVAPFAAKNFVADAYADYETQRRALLVQQQKLLSDLEERSKPSWSEFFGALSQFGRPTATGSFAESAGNVGAAFSAVNKAQEERQKELAQMRLAVGKQQLDVSKESIDLAKTRFLGEQIINALSGDKQSAVNLGIGDGGQSVIDSLDPQTRRLIAVQATTNPAEAMKSLISLGMKQAEIPDAIKTLNAHIASLPPEQKGPAKQFAAQAAIVPPQQRIEAFSKLSELVDKGLMTQQTMDLMLGAFPTFGTQVPQPSLPISKMAGKPEDVYRSIQSIADPKEREAALSAYGRQLSGSQTQGYSGAVPFPAVSRSSVPPATPPVSAIPPAVSSPVAQAGIPPVAQVANQPASGLAPAQQREVAAAAARKMAEGKAEDTLEAERQIRLDAKAGQQLAQTAQAIVEIVKKQPAAFEVLNVPGVAAAINSLVTEAVRVGSYTIGVPGFTDAIRNLSLNREQMNAFNAVSQLALQTQLGMNALKGQGAVSNFERQLVGQASISPTDRPEILMYKADLLGARGRFDQFIQQKFLESKMSALDFKNSAQYKKWVNQYDSSLSKVRAKYLGGE
jgi:hypothetical protein